MTKILHVLTSNVFSGAENVACQIIKMFEGTDYEMVYSSPDGPVAESLRKLGIPFVPMKELNKNELKRVISEVKPDIIHAHDMRASFITSLAKGSIPYVSHIHNNNFNSRGWSLKSIVYYFAARQASHVIWVSKSAFTGYKFSNRLKDKSTTLYNVIDLATLKRRHSEATDAEASDVIYLGRLSAEKNPLRLIDVLNIAISRRPSLKALIVGKGALESDVINRIKSYGIEANVILKGFVDNPFGLLANARLMMMTSLWEGTPMCALESMGLGTPIVSTPVDGLVDLIRNGENGYFGSTDQELADAIIRICDDGDLRQRLSDNACRDASRINDTDNYRKTLQGIYKNALESH